MGVYCVFPIVDYNEPFEVFFFETPSAIYTAPRRLVYFCCNMFKQSVPVLKLEQSRSLKYNVIKQSCSLYYWVMQFVSFRNVYRRGCKHSKRYQNV